MRADRRAFVVGAYVGACLAALSPTSWADEPYPSRPIALILPYAAGGGTDAIARVFARGVEEALGGTIVVENRPGAAGNIATDAVSGAKPDGYTLLIGNQGPMVVNPHLYKNMRSDPEQTLEPIILIANAALVIVVGPSLKLTTLRELIDEAKRRPDGLTYASASNASASHLATLLLERAAGIKARHVPYRGAAPALNDVVGGHVDFMVTTIPSVTGLIAGGRVTALAVTGPTRAAALPDVPTSAEAGLPGYTASAWYGLLAPKGLPADIRAKLESAARTALQRPDLLARVEEDGAAASGMGGAEFAAFMAAERKRWGEVIRDADLKPLEN
jgi:tripartite-type tricarboxylate transporter receptor subunit TctC